MTGVHLAIKVQKLLVAAEAEETALYCKLSTGSTCFTSKASAAAELFIVSPWELSHATKKPLPAAPSTHHDHSKPLTSPVLTVELISAKRWGADAVVATGELLLGPLLDQLQPNGPGYDVVVALAKTGNKTGSKVPRSASTAAAASSPGGDTAVAGPDALAVVLQLSAVIAPPVPEKLLGPEGTGRVEVPPKACADASWLNWQQPVLHTGAGHVYLTPTVQLLRVTLHEAHGLQNLHVDPHAAAAAAAAIGRLAATGSSPSRADRAKAAAERAVLDGTRAGRNLLQHTSSWFRRSKSAAGLAAGSSTSKLSALDLQRPTAGKPLGSSPSSNSSSPQPVTGTVAPMPAWFPVSASGSITVPQMMPESTAAPGSDDAPSQQQPASEDAAAASTLAQLPRSSSSTQVAGGAVDLNGSPRLLQDSISGGSSGTSSTAQQPVLPAASDSAAAPGPLAAAEGAVEPALPAAANALQPAEAAAGDTVGGLEASRWQDRLADPVSRLQQATRHMHNNSVDEHFLIGALESNGFHATDAPGGAFFYARISLVSPQDSSSSGSTGTGPGGGGSGSNSHCSRVVGVSKSGQAIWQQGFWLTLVRPAPAGTVLELELFAAKDDKTRGKSVAVVRAPLAPLMPVDQPVHRSAQGRSQQQDKASGPPWAHSSHVLHASFSDHLHCSFSITLEVADWDLRAQQEAIPRAITAGAEAAAAAGAVAAAVLDTAEGSIAATAGLAAAGETPGGAAGSSGVSAVPSSSAMDSPTGTRQASSSSASNAAVAAADSAADVGLLAAGDAELAAGEGVKGADALAPPPVASLDLVVKGFDTLKALDVFFVLLLGPYCLVSSTSHSTHHHHWGWHLKVPVSDPSDVMTLALLAREDQAGGRKRVGAAMLTLFSSSIKLVGKLRVRLSTLPLNTPLNLRMALQGERTNLRAGQQNAAVAHLYMHLVAPQLLRSYLPAYVRYTATSPQLYLLSTSPGVAGPDSTLEALAAEVAATTARWVEQQPPQLPVRVFRKVQDSGRGEFTLSRTRANWRRLMLLRDATAPAREAFSHLCSWNNTWHSGGWYCIILMFGVWPSKVLAIALLLLAASLLRKGMRPPQAAAAALPAAAAAGAAAAAAASRGTKGAGAAALALAAGAAGTALVAADGPESGGRVLLPLQPPPAMWDPSYALPDEQPSGALPTDPYTSLKQNYEAVISFLTLVQNVIDGWASAGERLLLAFSWTDRLATSVLLGLMLLLSLGLWLLGLQVLVTAGLLWVFRHPVLRTPLPPPPVNFVWRLPTRSDTML